MIKFPPNITEGHNDQDLTRSLSTDLSKDSFIEDIDHSIFNLYSTFEKVHADISQNSIAPKRSVIIEESNDLSSYKITTGGLVEEHWDVIQNISARLLEVNEKNVVLECLIDVENKIFQNRLFGRELIEGLIPLKSLYPIIIKIFKRRGEQKIQFIDGKNLVNLSQFKEDYFSKISPNIFNKIFNP